MPTLARAVLLAAGLHAASLTGPSLALAQAPQPVPYQTAPIPYGQPPPTPAPPSQPSTTGTHALSPSSAPSVGADVIYLRNGGILRGTIIDAIPNAQARIQLATGEIATVPWSEIARFDHAGATPPSSAPPRRPEESPEPSRTASTPVRQVLVHIDSPSPVDLQRRVDPDATAVGLGTRARAKASWETVCTAPCDRAVPAHGSYRIAGNGARPSREFMLPDAGRPVSLNVSPSSNGWFIGGIVLLSVGSITALVGLCIGLIGSLASTVDNSGTAQDWATGGWTTFAIGGVGAVVGAIALVGNSHSDVSFPTADTAGKGPGSPWAHVATWREPAPVERAVPPPLAAPVFKLSF